MPHSPGKFCLDRKLVRWSLLNGNITRKTSKDDPLGGENVAATEVTRIEKTTYTQVDRPRHAWLTVITGIALLILAWQIDTALLRVMVGVLAFAAVYSGILKIRPRRTVHDAYRLIIPGRNADEWMVVGSTPDVLGFVEAVKMESTSNGNIHLG